jgi:DNA-binding CsgD family transcriptional regulator
VHGRESELARIDAALTAAHDGRGGALLIRGPAGTGTSTLLQAAGDRAGAMRVLACRGSESETGLPFAGLHALLRPVMGAVASLPPTQAAALRCALGLTSGPEPERFLVCVAALHLLSGVAAQRPVLCAVDDAHRLDAPTADVVAFVARRLACEPVAALLTAPAGEPTWLDGLGLPELRVSALDADASRALLADRRPAELSPGVADWLVDAAGGNPLALVELSSHLTPEQRAGTEPIVEPVPIDPGLEHALLQGVRALPADTRRMLLVAATDESGDLLAILDAGARLGLAAGALDPAQRARLVAVRGTWLAFGHPLLRSALYQGAALSERRAAHAALASVAAGDAAADRRAWHRAAASIEPDPAAVAELEEAAHRARARGAYDIASVALERAASLAPDDAGRARLLVAAAEDAWLPGRAPRALALLRRARSLEADAGTRADGARVLGVIELTCGVPADAREILVDGAAGVAEADPDRALYLLSLAGSAAALARDAGAVAAIERTASELGVADTPANRFQRTRLAGLHAHVTGRLDDAARLLAAAIELAEASRLPERLALVSPVALFLCDERAVLTLHRRAAAHAREEGRLTVLTQALPWVALGDLWSGNCAGAAAAVAEGRALATATGQHQIAAHLQAIEALIAAVRGEEATCRALAGECLTIASARRLVHVASCATWALCVLELGLGSPEAALAHTRALPRAAGVDWDALDRIEAAVRAGERDAAAAALEEFAPWASSSAAPWGRAVELHCRALLTADPGRAAELFREALAAHERAGRPFERARTELALGELLRRTRRRSEARSHLRAALGRFEALGARLWAQRARAELRASGATARRRDPSTLDELTAQEVQIARLVAEGHTNRDVAGRLFLSPRTIDFHLRNIFRKLAITSRTELARMDLAPGG